MQKKPQILRFFSYYNSIYLMQNIFNFAGLSLLTSSALFSIVRGNFKNTYNIGKFLRLLS